MMPPKLPLATSGIIILLTVASVVHGQGVCEDEAWRYLTCVTDYRPYFVVGSNKTIESCAERECMAQVDSIQPDLLVPGGNDTFDFLLGLTSDMVKDGSMGPSFGVGNDFVCQDGVDELCAIVDCCSRCEAEARDVAWCYIKRRYGAFSGDDVPCQLPDDCSSSPVASKFIGIGFVTAVVGALMLG